MKITLITCNRLKNGPEAALVETYIKRLPYSVEIIEIESKKKDEVEQYHDENTQILSALSNISGYIIAMDERGKDLSSRAFAKHIQQKILPQHSHLIFLIGGSSGLNDDVKSKASLQLCMGRMTWPHKLARVMLFEQIYRAHTIMTNPPYHKD